jgi:hypothetical protein
MFNTRETRRQLRAERDENKRLRADLKAAISDCEQAQRERADWFNRSERLSNDITALKALLANADAPKPTPPAAATSQAEIERLQRLVAAKDTRIRTLEETLDDRQRPGGDAPLRPSIPRPADIEMARENTSLRSLLNEKENQLAALRDELLDLQKRLARRPAVAVTESTAAAS